MPPQKKQAKKSIRTMAKELGMSHGHLDRAYKAGVDVSDPEALAHYRKGIHPRVNGATAGKPIELPPDAPTMTIEEIETALRTKGIDITSAKILKTQLDGLKAAMAYRKETNDLLSREEVAAAFVKIAASLNAALRVAESEIPQRCLGLPLAESRPITKEILRGLQAKLADAESEFWNEYPEMT